MTRDAMRFSTAGTVVVSILLWAGMAWSVPSSIQHQGRLLADDGTPKTGQQSLQFTIYDAKSGGSIVWQSPAKSIDLGDDGFYSVSLGGRTNAIDASKLGGQNLWIGLKVNGSPLSPRVPIKSVPYAVRSGMASSVADGSVGSKALQNNAVGNTALKSNSVTSNNISGVDWNKIKNTPDTLGGLSCANGETAVYQNGQWKCGSSGTPLAGKSCNRGQLVRGISRSGTLQCASDSDTTYSAGNGLRKRGTTFKLADKRCSGAVSGVKNGRMRCTSVGDIESVRSGKGLSGGSSSGRATLSADYRSVQQRVNDSCSSGEFMVGINRDGSVNCKSGGGGGGSTSCSNKSFEKVQKCPIGSNDLRYVDCDVAPKGAFCEYDSGSGCSSLDSSLNNCGGYDWYLRTR